MSKDKAIADIVKNLDSLTLEENQSILQYIKRRKEHKTKTSQAALDNWKKAKEGKVRSGKHVDKDGAELSVGDEVYLLTKGVDNYVGEPGTVEHLPATVGEFVLFKRERLRENGFAAYIHKKGTSVRKKPQKP